MPELRERRGGESPRDGSVLSATAVAATWLEGHGAPGATIRADHRVVADGKPHSIAESAGNVNGGLRLVADGEVAIAAAAAGIHWEEDLGFSSRFGLCRNPRTTAGVTADGRILLVAVDGRQPGYSVGAGFAEEPPSCGRSARSRPSTSTAAARPRWRRPGARHQPLRCRRAAGRGRDRSAAVGRRVALHPNETELTAREPPRGRPVRTPVRLRSAATSDIALGRERTAAVARGPSIAGATEGVARPGFGIRVTARPDGPGAGVAASSSTTCSAPALM